MGSGVGDAEAAMVPFALLSGAQGTFAQDVEEPERGLPWEVSTRGDSGDPICWVRERRPMDEAQRNNKENGGRLRAMESISHAREMDLAQEGGIGAGDLARRKNHSLLQRLHVQRWLSRLIHRKFHR